MFEGRTVSLAGIWSASFGKGRSFDVRVPGTLDESNVGHADSLPSGDVSPAGEPALPRGIPKEQGLLYEEPSPEKKPEDLTITTRYTRKYTFEGPVCFSRPVSFREDPEKRLFLSVERARFLHLFIDGREVPCFAPPTLIAPQVFEVTGLMNGLHTLTILSDNSYAGLPRETILASGMADDNTQTNWNGLLGRVCLREEAKLFIDRLTVRTKGGRASCYLEISSQEPCEGVLRLSSRAFGETYEQPLSLVKKNTPLLIEGIGLKEELLLWDEGKGNLYEFTAEFLGAEKTVVSGVRDIRVDSGGRIILNSRRVFLRGNTDCAVYPESGHMPMDRASWDRIFSRYAEYGVNFVRFASCCPPEEAFRAADERGLLLMIELSLAESSGSFSDERSGAFYRQELLRALRVFGNHPSFVMLSLGSRLQLLREEYPAAQKMLSLARQTDPSRLYAIGTGVKKPGGFTRRDGDFAAYSVIAGPMPGVSRRMALIAFNSAPFSILPDFSELDLFSGFLQPKNIERMRENAEKRGLLTSWKRFVSASGETALLSRRLCIEKNYRNYRLSGMALLSLMDYPGRGSAMFGLMNTHLQPKPWPFAEPRRFASFYSEQVLTAELSRSSFVYGESFRILVSVTNYAKETAVRELSFSISGKGVSISGTLPRKSCPPGRCTVLGCIRGTLLTDEDRIRAASGETADPAAGHEEDPFRDPLSVLMKQLFPEEPGEASEPGIPGAIPLTLTLRSGRLRADYSLFLYPSVLPVCPENVFEADGLSADAVSILRSGGTVFFTPPASGKALPGSLKTGFSPMLFNETVCPESGSTVGALIRKDHPVFRFFPTEEYPDARWLRLLDSRAVYLPEGVTAMISEMDSCRGMRRLGRLFECRVLNGNVLFSSLGLKEKIHLPEGRNLLKSIYAYLESYDFSPSQTVSLEELKKLLRDS